MRLAFKTTSYGITHIVVATAVAYTLTQNIAAAIGIGLIEPIIQTGVYSLHEYLWERPKTAISQNASETRIIQGSLAY